MIEWITKGKLLESSCGTFQIDNRGKRGGIMYALRTKGHRGMKQFENCYCNVLTVGTMQECKERAERETNLPANPDPDLFSN